MKASTRKVIQVFLLLALVLAAARVYFTFRSRQATDWGQKQEEAKNAPLNADYYVNPKKLHAQNLKQARDLTKQPAWVREGFKYAYYAHTRGKTDFRKPAGLLGPIEKLNITDVVEEKAPEEPGKQVMAVFEKEGKSFSVPIGVVEGDSYQIFADEMLFIEDPRELYKHWPSEVWQAIDAHQVKPGMNELQASFAVGAGALDSGSRTDQRVVKYPNGGNPLIVTYQDGKATEVKQGTPEAG